MSGRDYSLEAIVLREIEEAGEIEVASVIKRGFADGTLCAIRQANGEAGVTLTSMGESLMRLRLLLQ